MLGFQSMNECIDALVPINNSAMHSICLRELNIPKPTFRDSNRVISSCISGLTFGNRSTGSLNYSVRKILTNLVPFASLKILISSPAPLNQSGNL